MKPTRLHRHMGGDENRRRLARRPAAHFLGLDESFHVIDTAWKLAEHDRDRRTYANALRAEVKAMTGLRLGELHNLRPNDIRPDGTLNVRMLKPEDSPWGRSLKYAKPRVTTFVNGVDESPTLTVLRDYIAERGLSGEDYIWPSGPYAWWHWVVHRLGPLTGLQRRIEKLDGNDADEGAPRYLIHPHTFRAMFVMFCRRWPRALGEEPTEWDTICALGGWESVDCIKRNYYYAELDEHIASLKASMPAALVAGRTPPRAIELRTPRAPRPVELRAMAGFFRGPVTS